MQTQRKDSFNIIGISVRTTNEHNQAAIDIPALWGKFMAENILNQIPNKVNSSIYCVYTNYKKDYTKPYTTILGCKVESLESIPEGMVGIKIKENSYAKFTAQGNLTNGVVFNEWLKIWNSELPRAYTADFEIYDERSLDQTNATVDIFISTLL
jgi:predicted transcriptional regulator YdeE